MPADDARKWIDPVRWISRRLFKPREGAEEITCYAISWLCILSAIFGLYFLSPEIRKILVWFVAFAMGCTLLFLVSEKMNRRFSSGEIGKAMLWMVGGLFGIAVAAALINGRSGSSSQQDYRTMTTDELLQDKEKREEAAARVLDEMIRHDEAEKYRAQRVRGNP